MKQTRQQKIEAIAAKVSPMIVAAKPLADIVKYLNDNKIQTVNGHKWTMANLYNFLGSRKREKKKAIATKKPVTKKPEVKPPQITVGTPASLNEMVHQILYSFYLNDAKRVEMLKMLFKR